jgi:hypothetical protein
VSPFVAFETIRNEGTSAKYRPTWTEHELSVGHIETIYVYMSDYKVYISVYFVSDGLASPPSSVVVGQIVAERNVSLLVTGELDNVHHGALFQVKKKRISTILLKLF